MNDALFAVDVDSRPVPASRPRVGRRGVYYARTTTAYRRELTTIFAALYRGEPIGEAVEVAIWHTGMASNADPDNLAKSVLDSLVSARVLADDHWPIVGRLVVEFLPGGPGLRVRIRRLPTRIESAAARHAGTTPVGPR